MAQPAVTRVVEDYVTLIWKAFEWPGGAPTTTGLAEQLGVTASTVSATLKKLAADGFIEYEAYGPITLTETGRRVAVDIVRRHRIVESYLVRVLGVPWDEVHAEADRLEHAVSDSVLERMDRALGHPTHDPHGDPIPDASGRVRAEEDQSLTEVAPGTRVVIGRISDRSSAVLRYLESLEVTVGAVVVVDDVNVAADAIRLSVAGSPVQLSHAAAAAIRVRPA